MKQFILSMMVALFTLTVAAAPNDTIKASKDDSTYVPTYVDTKDDGTTVESTSVDSVTYGSDDDEFDIDDDGIASVFSDLAGHSSLFAVSASVIACIVLLIPIIFLLLPVIILLLILHYRNKRRRERYRLIEKAIENGQPLPADFEAEYRQQRGVDGDERSKGIKNICLGAGLTIFLWAATGSFAFGCIGLLVGFRGLGQYLTADKKMSAREKTTTETTTKPTEETETKDESAE
jgi:hypothetical protein